jgi:signal transduction histidine kinase
LARLLTAQEEERGHIARDLHDGLGQSLTCLTVGLRAIEESSQDEQIREHVRELRRIGSATHEEIRRISSGLRPSVLDDLGLAAALERYFDDVGRINSIQTSLELDGLRQSRLPRPIETALYRIVQEATSNAIRHGAATNIRLSVRLSSQSIELEIQDNGRGFDPYTALRQRSGQKMSVGLSSIRERVALLSGGIRFDSRPGEGTRVVVRIQLKQNDDVNDDASVPETHSPGLFDSGAGL